MAEFLIIAIPGYLFAAALAVIGFRASGITGETRLNTVSMPVHGPSAAAIPDELAG